MISIGRLSILMTFLTSCSGYIAIDSEKTSTRAEGVESPNAQSDKDDGGLSSKDQGSASATTLSVNAPDKVDVSVSQGFDISFSVEGMENGTECASVLRIASSNDAVIAASDVKILGQGGECRLIGKSATEASGSVTLTLESSVESVVVAHSIVVTVIAQNAPFQWNERIDDFTVAAHTAISRQAKASDADAAVPVVYGLDLVASNCDEKNFETPLTVDTSTGVLTGRPAWGEVGACTVWITATSEGETLRQEVVLTILGDPIPAAPNGFAAIQMNSLNGELTVSWQPVAGATGYLLWHSTDGDAEWSPTHGQTYAVGPAGLAGAIIWLGPTETTSYVVDDPRATNHYRVFAHTASHVYSSAATTATAPLDVAVDIKSSAGTTCALLASGALKCWGSNSRGRLGLGASPGTVLSPLASSIDFGAGRKAIKFDLMAYGACALLDDGLTKCWGHDNNFFISSLGIAASGNQSTPQPGPAIPTGRKAIDLTINIYGTCLVLDDNSISCTGDAVTRGSIAASTTLPLQSQVASLQIAGRINDITGFADAKVCAIDANGRLFCWGRGKSYLGYGDIVDRTTPEATELNLGTNHGALQVANAFLNNTVLRDDGQVIGWGFNNSGALGFGDTTVRSSTSDIIPIGIGRSAKRVFMTSTMGGCILLSDDTYVCWTPGQIPKDLTPVAAGGTPRHFTVDDDNNTFCAIYHDWSTECWGRNDQGELGLGITGGSYPSPSGNRLDFGL